MSSPPMRRRAAVALGVLAAGTLLLAASLPATAQTSQGPSARPSADRAAQAAAGGPVVEGPIRGSVPGDPAAPAVEDTYPFFATDVDLESVGYVEEEFYLSGTADGYSVTGEPVATDVPYRTRIVVRRPAADRHYNGTALMEWQNVSAGYDLDALWFPRQTIRDGYAWIGVSAQRVGVDQLRGWSPARYGDLDVTGGGEYVADELSYDIFSQAAAAVRARTGADPMGGLKTDKILGIGASQSAYRMDVYYDEVLRQTEDGAFDGFGFIVGTGPSRQGSEPAFHILSETDVRTSLGRRPDDEVYRRWEVAGAAHSGFQGQQQREAISARDLGAAPSYDCTSPPFSRVPLYYVISEAYEQLAEWIDGEAPPHAPYLEFSDPTTMVRDELGLAQGGIRLSQVTAPTALNTGVNGGETFCVLFGTHQPFGDDTLASLYPNHGRYVAQVTKTGTRNVRSGYLDPRDALADTVEAAKSTVGKRRRH